jgi:hypothetical protein
MDISAITPTDPAKQCNQGGPINLVDVRTPIEFRELHATPARNVPLEQLDPAAVMRARQGPAGEPLYVVCLGVLLAWLVHPAFIGLSAFVGAPLIFAGVTDTCGMGMLLARMPWNRTA